jgi:ABC-type transport system involved in multi-copper enzyme maturation permease subunit
MNQYLPLFAAGWMMVLPLVVALIPLAWQFDGRPFQKWIKDPATAGYLLGGWALLGVVFGYWMKNAGDLPTLELYGHMYGSILHVSLLSAFVILAPRILLVVWPKGGAIAFAAFQESLRQPMFWLILVLGNLLIAISMVIPYFTLGDDYKLMKQVGFDAIMLFTALFGLLAASISINEEIEGRTAITVISKPVNRRQFLIGKYVGILLACWVLVLLLGVTLTWALKLKPRFDTLDDVVDPMPIECTQWLTPKIEKPMKSTTEGAAFARGVAQWAGATLAHHIGLFRVFGQVMIMLSICTALATRVSFVVNLVICLGVFLIGNLSPLMVYVTNKPENADNPAFKLISFLAQLFNAIFPSLDSFDMGPAIIRDTPLATLAFMGFVGTVFLYAVLYTAIALFAGLFLFEERDLA